MQYVGSTQQSLKRRMTQHFDDVKKYFRRETHTDTFAKHMIQHFTRKPTNEKIRNLCKFQVINSINPFSFTKKARSHDCRLCLAEKSKLVWKRLNKVPLMNANSEIYGPCRHNPRFHRFPKKRTDELGESEKENLGVSSESIPLCMEIPAQVQPRVLAPRDLNQQARTVRYMR